MAKFVVDLSPEHRAKLDSLRAEMGLRSEAEALRFIIMFGHPMPQPEVERVMKEIRDRVEPKASFQSRLKGEWKAP